MKMLQQPPQLGKDGLEMTRFGEKPMRPLSLRWELLPLGLPKLSDREVLMVLLGDDSMLVLGFCRTGLYEYAQPGAPCPMRL